MDKFYVVGAAQHIHENPALAGLSQSLQETNASKQPHPTLDGNLS